METFKQVALIVLDGWGYRPDTKDNAIAEASTPFFDYLWNAYPHSHLHASEDAVGLPEGQIGTSEVGHMTIGAGKVIQTDLVRINKAIADGDFKNNPAFTQLFNHVKEHKSTLHVLGLVSAGGVHSHQEHLYAFLRAAKEAGVNEVAIHAFTDGRDTAPQSGHEYLKELEKVIQELGVGFIATATGRFYAMDRDKNWDRIEIAERAIFHGEGKVAGQLTPSQVLHQLHREGALDEHVEPVVFLDDTGKSYTIGKNDAVFYFNYRTDRAKQLTERVLKRTEGLNVKVATLTQYDTGLKTLVAFPPAAIEATLAKEISKAGFSQAHIAETEKYSHATFFLNGKSDEKQAGEEHVLIESRKDIKTHDEAPEMRAKEIADEAVKRIEEGVNFIFINFANADMVGHTGNKEATIKAVEVVDRELKRVVESLTSRGGVALITADHGNAELNVDQETGHKHTAHTTNLVPAIATVSGGELRDGGLSDVAPTVLGLLGIKKPAGMTGKVLLERKR